MQLFENLESEAEKKEIQILIKSPLKYFWLFRMIFGLRLVLWSRVTYRSLWDPKLFGYPHSSKQTEMHISLEQHKGKKMMTEL